MTAWIPPGISRTCPLAAAIRYANIKVMRVLLDGGADVNGRSEANTPLCEAIGNSYGSNADDMVLVLLRRKADPNLKCAQGDSPPNKAEVLISRGAHVNARDSKGESVLANHNRLNSDSDDRSAAQPRAQ